MIYTTEVRFMLIFDVIQFNETLPLNMFLQQVFIDLSLCVMYTLVIRQWNEELPSCSQGTYILMEGDRKQSTSRGGKWFGNKVW